MKTEYMENAYGLLYEMDRNLNNYVERTMSLAYGTDWFIRGPINMKHKPFKKPLSSFYYHELISTLKNYPCFQLVQTIPIRNKIAHCVMISNEEMKSFMENTFCSRSSIFKSLDNRKKREDSIPFGY